MKKIRSIVLVSLSLVISLLLFAKKIEATSVDVTSNPLGVASKFKYFATAGNLTFSNSGVKVNARIAANTVDFGSNQVWLNTGGASFESDATLASPALVLGKVTSDNTNLLRGIGTANYFSNTSNKYIADSVTLPTNVDNNFLTQDMLKNVSSRKSDQSVSDYFKSLNSGVTSFANAKTQLESISSQYEQGTTTGASVTSSTGTNNIETFNITLDSSYSGIPIVFLNVDSSAQGIDIEIPGNSSVKPYIVVNWPETEFTFSNKYYVNGLNISQQQWAPYIINNFSKASSVDISNAWSGYPFTGAILAPNASVNVGNSYESYSGYITNVVGSNIQIDTQDNTSDSLITSDSFPGTGTSVSTSTPTISSVTFKNDSSDGVAEAQATTSDGTITIPVTANTTNATTAEITTSSDLGSDYHTFVKVNDGSWQSFTNGQTISSLTGYSKSLTSSSANSTSTADSTTTIGLNLQRSNKLTFAIAKTADPTKVDDSNPSTFTTTLDETGTLTATMPTTTSVGNVALGSTTGTTSSDQDISFTNTFGVNASLTVSLIKDTTVSNLFYDPTAVKIKIEDNSLNPFSVASDTMSDSNTVLSNTTSNTASTTFALNVALGNSTTTMKEVTPGQSYTIPLYWSISYSGNGN
ncbi:hypothetical protein LB941_08885 [Ligilactobacillus sp. WILCCON 0076]|uniref:Choice-of-anchor A domain-containing protein n=1 Tax=Ligilactobacillus ubinensis TaxID=2876789 RepID=A0A9X2FLA5_9LACO|nr:hypothetical protein [Ligilactobacillus ubinensis]MCP0887450.1 hypothetical protein [Ligilactobacillus ubinensis]